MTRDEAIRWLFSNGYLAATMLPGDGDPIGYYLTDQGKRAMRLLKSDEVIAALRSVAAMDDR
jgi:hypothetical protein